MTDADQWWRDAVVYQVYPRSFADSDGDGEGDLPGLTARLEHLHDLGVDALWLSPFYLSPQVDGGYDVADYRSVDPRFGTLADADALVERAAQLGLRVLVDLVPNHSSDQHPWFQAAVRAGPGSPERDRYVFRDGSGPGGTQPPNNWRSVFGGPAWTRVTEADGHPGQWYLHLFDAGQPDWNWRNEQVREEFRSVLRFWLDRGVAGFRVDVAHGLVKRRGLPDYGRPSELLRSDGPTEVPEGPPRSAAAPMWDQDEVHEVYADWRRVLDSYPPPERILCGEAWVTPAERLARYVAPGRMHQVFTFDLLDATWDAADIRRAVQRSLDVLTAVGRRAPGCSPATTSCATPVASACPAVPGPPASGPQTRSRTARSGCAGRGPSRRSCSPCPERPTSTRARSSGFPSTRPCRTRCARTPHSGGPVGPSPAGTDAGCLCRGPPTFQGWASGPRDAPGCRSRRATASTPSTARAASPARRSSSTAPCCRCVAGTAWGAAR